MHIGTKTQPSGLIKYNSYMTIHSKFHQLTYGNLIYDLQKPFDWIKTNEIQI